MKWLAYIWAHIIAAYAGIIIGLRQWLRMRGF